MSPPPTGPRREIGPSESLAGLSEHLWIEGLAGQLRSRLLALVAAEA